jgi:hypothetical protein
MDQSGLKVLPIYLVIDVSASMANGADLDATGAIVPAVAAPARNPALAGCTGSGYRFLRYASVRLPLGDPLGRDAPVLAAHDGSDYVPASTPARGVQGDDRTHGGHDDRRTRHDRR